MKLLDEKLVEEAAINYARKCTYGVWKDDAELAFKDGVKFAEQQLKEKIIEFAEWLNFGNHPYSVDNWCVSENYKKWHDDGTFKTTAEMLEQFLNKE